MQKKISIWLNKTTEYKDKTCQIATEDSSDNTWRNRTERICSIFLSTVDLISSISHLLSLLRRSCRSHYLRILKMPDALKWVLEKFNEQRLIVMHQSISKGASPNWLMLMSTYCNCMVNGKTANVRVLTASIQPNPKTNEGAVLTVLSADFDPMKWPLTWPVCTSNISTIVPCCRV